MRGGFVVSVGSALRTDDRRCRERSCRFIIHSEKLFPASSLGFGSGQLSGGVNADRIICHAADMAQSVIPRN